MPRSGNTYTYPVSSFTPGTAIKSADADSNLSDSASVIGKSLSTDGQGFMTGPILAASTGTAAAPSYAFSGRATDGFYPGASAGNISITLQGVASFNFSSSGLALANGVNTGRIVGEVIDYAGTSAPTGWFFCNGQTLSTTTYAALFGVCGTTYNTGGEPGGTFRLPDYRGRAGYGVDNMGGASAANRITSGGSGIAGTTLGGSGGAQSTSLATGNVPSHTHGYSGTTSTENQSHTHSFTMQVDSGHLGAGAGSLLNNLAGTTTTGNASQTHTHTYSGTTDGGSGSGTSFGTMNPALMINKLIYAGVP